MLLSSCSDPHAAILMQSSCSNPHAAVLMQRSSCSHPHAAIHMLRSSCSDHAAILMQRSTCCGPHAAILMQRSSCSDPHAAVLMQRSSHSSYSGGTCLLDGIVIGLFLGYNWNIMQMLLTILGPLISAGRSQGMPISQTSALPKICLLCRRRCSPIRLAGRL
jgi:hypothetical protein